jgi:hypothetical protein
MLTLLTRNSLKEILASARKGTTKKGIVEGLYRGIDTAREAHRNAVFS